MMDELEHSDRLRDFGYCKRIKVEEVKCAISTISKEKATMRSLWSFGRSRIEQIVAN